MFEVTGNKKVLYYGAFTLDVKSVLNENLGGILGGMQCLISDSLILSECLNLT